MARAMANSKDCADLDSLLQLWDLEEGDMNGKMLNLLNPLGARVCNDEGEGDCSIPISLPIVANGGTEFPSDTDKHCNGGLQFPSDTEKHCDGCHTFNAPEANWCIECGVALIRKSVVSNTDAAGVEKHETATTIHLTAKQAKDKDTMLDDFSTTTNLSYNYSDHMTFHPPITPTVYSPHQKTFFIETGMRSKQEDCASIMLPKRHWETSKSYSVRSECCPSDRSSLLSGPRHSEVRVISCIIYSQRLMYKLCSKGTSKDPGYGCAYNKFLHKTDCSQLLIPN